MVTLRAFICYRRADAYVGVTPEHVTTEQFIGRFKLALEKLGFGYVFLDVDRDVGLTMAGHFEYKSFKAIELCDVFLPLIGTNWSTLLAGKRSTNSRDTAAREIKAAIDYERNIIPVLIDTLSMPTPEVLATVGIDKLHYITALHLQSNASVDDIVSELQIRVKDFSAQGTFIYRWRRAYTIYAIVAYYFCAINTNLVGWLEYGGNSWWGMAKMWGALFIWPVFFMPFVFYAFFGPITTIVENLYKAIKVRNVEYIVTYISPILVATSLAFGAWAVEVFDDRQVPWTIKPVDIFTCLPSPALRSRGETAGLDVMEALTHYDADDSLQKYYDSTADGRPFWLQNKCWPNVLFYLTLPVYSRISDPNLNAAYIDNVENSYSNSRRDTQRAFAKILQDSQRIALNIPTSLTAIAYRIAFFQLAWMGLFGVVLSGFLSMLRLKDALSDEERKLPADNAFMCLTYSLVTLMSWIPFRLITEYIKIVYSSPFEQGGIIYFNVENYIPDMMLFSTLGVGYIFAIVGMVARYKRFALALYGTIMTACFCALSYCIVSFREDAARLSQHWQFYIAVCVPLITIVFALWLLFDPARVHFREFRREFSE